MVNRVSRKTAAKTPPPSLPKFSTSIKLSEVIEEGLRFEAGAFNIEARRAVEKMHAAGVPLVPVYGEREGLCRGASNAFRFARVYVSAEYGVPFLSSSDIITLRPEIDHYLSRKLTDKLDELIIRKWDVLISCSGTVGNVGVASDIFAGKALSQHAIRLRAVDPESAGYVAAFLRSRYGRPQLINAQYGSVIRHIEPLHLRRVLIPELAQHRARLGKKITHAYELRDEANRLLGEADTELHAVLKLPILSSLSPRSEGPVIMHTPASALSSRFEASFHEPVALRAREILDRSGLQISSLGNRSVTTEIRPITKFRKRVYVPRGGIPMLSSKQLMQIDPVDIKRLAKGAHTKDLPEITLRPNMVTISRSGTIGRIQIIPAYMDGWAASEHATRILAAPGLSPGYLFAWLSSDYGQRLVKRYSYGSVILEIDRDMLESVPIPLPSPEIRDQIGGLVLRANELRDQAWRLERETIEELESLIEGVPRRPPRPI